MGEEDVRQFSNQKGGGFLTQRERRAGKEGGGRSLNHHDVLLEGHPAEELDAYARGHAIDLIVVGTHGRKGLDRLLIGSVTDKVIRTASVPVMVVHCA